MGKVWVEDAGYWGLTVNERLYMKRKIKMIREFVHDKGVSRLWRVTDKLIRVVINKINRNETGRKARNIISELKIQEIGHFW